ncbi:hypothetical protein [Dolichospermum flos-aquae]|uniref:Uncharacterized protein n=1 Tax=Dolichospermum flos-aquae LEGE 04289 TaxID=1828708 RepID=A0ACC5Q6K9_DOLFA|nr:hypothetical protein [Dolichospermum flos-aquae]MBE9220851.1 hypothetical protein [Dolichospermum flos-aquae LEGE 04289]
MTGDREEGRGKREEGRGDREEGRGDREEGRGKRLRRERQPNGFGQLYFSLLMSVFFCSPTYSSSQYYKVHILI